MLREKQREWDILEQKLNTEIYDLKDLVEHERLSAIEQQKLESQKWQQEVMVRTDFVPALSIVANVFYVVPGV